MVQQGHWQEGQQTQGGEDLSRIITSCLPVTLQLDTARPKCRHSRSHRHSARQNHLQNWDTGAAMGAPAYFEIGVGVGRAHTDTDVGAVNVRRKNGKFLAAHTVSSNGIRDACIRVCLSDCLW